MSLLWKYKYIDVYAVQMYARGSFVCNRLTLRARSAGQSSTTGSRKTPPEPEPREPPVSLPVASSFPSALIIKVCSPPQEICQQSLRKATKRSSRAAVQCSKV
jgi:hypothetical protein